VAHATRRGRWSGARDRRQHADARADVEMLQHDGSGRTRPGGSRVARGGRRRPLKGKQRLRSSGTADCSRRIWRWPRYERASVLGEAEGASVTRLKRRRRSGLNWTSTSASVERKRSARGGGSPIRMASQLAGKGGRATPCASESDAPELQPGTAALQVTARAYRMCFCGA
jgi:hypothetical protein